MVKRIGLISIIGIIGVWMIIVLGFSNKITAEIPSETSFVPVFKDWNIHFSEPMDPKTFTEKTVVVANKNGEQVPLELEWNDSFTVLTIHAPKDGYSIDEQYEISFSDHVRTASGKALSKAFKHRFTAVADLPTIKNQKQLVQLLKERMNENRNEMVSMNEVVEESADSAGGAESKASTSGSPGSSTTNVQVQGIDEADIIKSDGKAVYFVRDSDILIASTEKEKSKVLSKINVKNYYPQELYLFKNLLIAIGNKSEPLRDKRPDDKVGIPEPIYHNQTTILVYDISKPNEPHQVREVSIDGYYNTSRLLDGYLYLIANEHPPYHILTDIQKDVDIRPFKMDTTVSDESIPVEFEDMYFFPESKEEQFLILTSLDLNNMKKEANVETYLGASNQIYMSHHNLYVAIDQYKNVESSKTESETTDQAKIGIWHPQEVNTEITQFRINKGKLTYNASTIVDGTLLNQFAMDERNNTFRVATTKGNTWDDEALSTNNLYTFDNDLQPLGSIEGLAEGERIYSVRFMEDVAYMVTFKEVDPLFVIDLKDPKKPTVLGELKIPGFSNYLHPLDENHVIGFGQHTELVKEDGMKEPLVRTDGIKISVFDVSDPTKPKEKFSEIIGQGGSYSELLHNHKVLFQHPTENLFGFPVVLSENKTVRKDNITYEEYHVIFEGALLYEISPENGIKLRDTITHQGEFEEYPEWTSEIKRLISVDDTIYTFSWDQMKAYDWNKKQLLTSVEFPELSFEY
ncbi:beta-propeller domain-containing protein [Ornithinibacillus scapharcae]|uniref:beta-propeller domain-containing protein n=1 Tax=Ornithinibacillus scapharcae TaxID=1147159 RepID=UPI000225B551|nr:beta-propeller domain-containing protein [Ornithinibacillus scapharcae]